MTWTVYQVKGEATSKGAAEQLDPNSNPPVDVPEDDCEQH
jgi:hypothetical protein